jgi:hypothetical protein
MPKKLNLATKNKRNLGAKHRARGKTNSTFLKRNSCSNGREELGRRVLKLPTVMNYKKCEHWEVRQHNREAMKSYIIIINKILLMKCSSKKNKEFIVSLTNAIPWTRSKWQVCAVLYISSVLIIKPLRVKFLWIREVFWVMVESINRHPD